MMRAFPDPSARGIGRPRKIRFLPSEPVRHKSAKRRTEAAVSLAAYLPRKYKTIIYSLAKKTMRNFPEVLGVQAEEWPSTAKAPRSA